MGTTHPIIHTYTYLHLTHLTPNHHPLITPQPNLAATRRVQPLSNPTAFAGAPLVFGLMEARTLALKPLANITMPSPSAPPPPPAPPRMPSGRRESLAAGASVGLVVLLCFLTCFICRVWRRNRYYSKVQRTLDEEERAFQECAFATATHAYFRNHRGP